MKRLTTLGCLLLVAGGVAGFASLWPGDTSHACGQFGPFDFDTFEREAYVADYNAAIELAAEGTAITFSYSIDGSEIVDMRYQGLEQGPRSARQPADTAHRVPPGIFKSIVWIESNWANADATVQYGSIGPALRSFDCGFGLSQVTTGMANTTGVPSARQAVIGTHFLFNLAEGVRILADKWNSAPQFRPIAGTGDPGALEDWYFAIWSYNGFAFVNHPLNPNLDPLRGGSEASPIYHCYEKSALGYQEDGNGYVKYGYGDYTYPERAYGCLRYPPLVRGGQAAPSVSAQSADTMAGEPRFHPGDAAIVSGTGSCLRVRANPGTGGAEVGCLKDGTQVTVLGGPEVADGFTWWNVQPPSPVPAGWVADPFLKKKTASPPAPPPPLEGPRMWAPQVFLMPDFSIGDVARAFNPENFIACEKEGFSGGCPEMDFPTSLPDEGISTHPDTTPPNQPVKASLFLGDPHLAYSGKTEIVLTASADGSASSETLVVTNTGTGVGPFRIRASAPWIVVRHAGDSRSRTLDGGVAVGSDLEVGVQAQSGSQPSKQRGASSRLVITADPATMPDGVSRGTVVIEPLLGGGGVFKVTVIATKAGTSSKFRLVIPGVSRLQQ